MMRVSLAQLRSNWEQFIWGVDLSCEANSCYSANPDVCGNKPYARTGLQFPLAIGGVVIYGRRRLRSGPSITTIRTGEESELLETTDKLPLSFICYLKEWTNTLGRSQWMVSKTELGLGWVNFWILTRWFGPTTQSITWHMTLRVVSELSGNVSEKNDRKSLS